MLADEVDELAASNEDTSMTEWGFRRGRGFSPEVIARFHEAALTLRRAAVMAQRIDWLVSGDDGETSFMRRWDQDLSKLDESYPPTLQD